MRLYLVVRHEDGKCPAPEEARITYDEADAYCTELEALYATEDDDAVTTWTIEELEMPLARAREEVAANG